MIATNSFTVDTNILIYSIDRSEPAKQFVADRIIRALYAKRAKLPLQCLKRVLQGNYPQAHPRVH